MCTTIKHAISTDYVNFPGAVVSRAPQTKCIRTVAAYPCSVLKAAVFKQGIVSVWPCSSAKLLGRMIPCFFFAWGLAAAVGLRPHCPVIWLSPLSVSTCALASVSESSCYQEDNCTISIPPHAVRLYLTLTICAKIVFSRSSYLSILVRQGVWEWKQCESLEGHEPSVHTVKYGIRGWDNEILKMSENMCIKTYASEE